MPRLSPGKLRQAYAESPLLPILLRSCRDLPSARNELRWLREDVEGKSGRSPQCRLDSSSARTRLVSACVERGRGKPLQYILGTQPFGGLEILCKPDVLIPRLETEAYTTHLAQSIVKNATVEESGCLGVQFKQAGPLRILDLCTGSGCIALLLHSLLSSHFPALKLLGIDTSYAATALALENLQSNVKAGRIDPIASKQINFANGNLFHEDVVLDGPWDILISNPPYVSPRSFGRDTSLSVRKYEPRMALVPPSSSVPPVSRNDAVDDQNIGDAFYPRLLDIARQIRAKLVVMEVADMNQALRVANLVHARNPRAECEIWRDWPDQASPKQESLQLGGRSVRVVGQGNGRAVVIRTNLENQQVR